MMDMQNLSKELWNYKIDLQGYELAEVEIEVQMQQNSVNALLDNKLIGIAESEKEKLEVAKYVLDQKKEEKRAEELVEEANKALEIKKPFYVTIFDIQYNLDKIFLFRDEDALGDPFFYVQFSMTYSGEENSGDMDILYPDVEICERIANENITFLEFK